MRGKYEKIKIMINRLSLVHTYNVIKSDPLKTWVVRDFHSGGSKFAKTHLQVLIELGLVKKVDVYVDRGVYHRQRVSVKGYRLINLKGGERV
jgi:hypothetical protein